MSKHKKRKPDAVRVSHPTEEDIAKYEAEVDEGMRVAADMRIDLRLRVGASRVEEGRVDTVLTLEGYGDNLGYLEVEDATLLMRASDGTPFIRYAVVNGVITEQWILMTADEMTERTEAIVGERLGVDDAEES